MPGVLYVVATPIGNLEDITFRAVRILREVDRIACEDTRQTRKLLDHYSITTPAVSYHEHNERTRSEELIRDLEAGKNLALVSDAGTPLIADPGYRIVEKARERGIAVVPVPGASALLSALSASGLPTDRFAFLGFLPAKSGQRKRTLLESRELKMPLVFFETPHRIAETLEDLAETFPGTDIVLARELTKVHEEFLRGTARELADVLGKRETIKGEFTVVVARPETVVDEEMTIEEEVGRLIDSGTDRMDALKEVARRRGLSKRDVYRQVRG